MEITNYEFKSEPYQHQLETLQESYHRNLFALFLEMGLGKSKILLDNAGILFEEGKISGLLTELAACMMALTCSRLFTLNAGKAK